jgi:hypothetical protein
LEKRRLAAQVIATYPALKEPLKEAQILEEPSTWLLAALLEEELPPGDTLVSASEILAWLGEAATRRNEDPAAFVWGKMRNVEQRDQRRGGREIRFAQEQSPQASVLIRLEALDGWQHLTDQEQQYLEDALSAPSQTALADQWKLTIKGVKTRLVRLRKKINNLLKKFGDL